MLVDRIVGDDLLVTNPIRVQKAIDEASCNALLLKVNQIGSVTESIEAVSYPQYCTAGIWAAFFQECQQYRCDRLAWPSRRGGA